MRGTTLGFATHAHRVAALACGLAIGILAATAPARAADITVTDARVAAGKLVVTGKTLTANTQVMLDSRFTATSNGSKIFTFNLAYLPADCVVGLVEVGSTAAPTRAVVADCEPKSVNSPGNWTSTTQYTTNDIVMFDGSRWRAKGSSIGKPPAANLTYWEQLVATHATKASGPGGAKGTAGVDADKGNTRPAGSNNLKCPKGQVIKWVSGALVCASRSSLPCCSIYD